MAITISRAQAQEEDTQTTMSEVINSGTVGVTAGSIGGTSIRLASDLASVLDDGNKIRILPIVGKGSIQNITDILYLKGIDIGIVQSDVLAHIKREGKFSNIDKRIAYITKLHNEELHLLASTKIKNIKDLAGKKVNFDHKGSGAQIAASIVFDTFKIKVQPVYYDQDLAIQKLKSGEIAATVYVTGKPAKIVSGLTPEDGIHILPVDYSPALSLAYLPSRFTHEDYPAIIEDNHPVKTIAAGAVMVVYNWKPDTERYQKVENFVKAFFGKFNEFLKKPRHPKWREVNLAAKLPGWIRFKPAQDWLSQHKTKSPAELKTAFDHFLQRQAAGGKLTDNQKKALFTQFTEWWKKRQKH